MDFLEHEVRIAFLLRHLCSPVDGLRRLAHALALGILDLNAVAGDDSDFAVFAEDDAPCIAQQRRNVGGDEVFSRSDAHHQWRPVARGHDLAAVAFAGNNGDPIYPFHILERAADGPFQVTVVIGFDQVLQDLRVGFRGENMALGHQAVLEIKIVLNDAIVGNVESSRTIPVGVEIDFARPSVRGPARVADSAFDGAVGGIGLPDLFFQRSDPADRTDDLGMPFVDNGDTTRIVTAVFEPFQAIEQHPRHFPVADIADDSAHVTSRSLEYI